MKKNRIELLILFFCFIFTCAVIVSVQGANFAEALQKSIYFYDAEKCGPGITSHCLEWRGGCQTWAKYSI